MLNSIARNLKIDHAVGIDLTLELLKKNKKKGVSLIQADALNIPFKDDSFEAVTAVAVIEHVPYPNKLLKEVSRVLKKDGIFILTSPDPFWDSIADRFIYKSDVGGHVKTFNLKRLKKYLRKNGFEVLNAEKFMMSPIGFPFENKIEGFLKTIHLNFFCVIR